MKVVFDMDTGVDDSLALIYALNRPAYEIQGIGCVYGNVESWLAAENTMKILDLVNAPDIPVVIGANEPLTGKWAGRVSIIHGENGLGNVELPLIYRGLGKQQRKEIAGEALSKVGLENRMDHRPNQLSGGQQQRVAVARAIAAQPPIILADEPTGNLDSKSTIEIMNILKDLHKSGRTVIIITHDDEIANQVDRVVRIMDGKIVSDSVNS